MTETNERRVVSIRGIASDGRGVGDTDGLTVFVSGAAAGDIVETELTKVKSSYAEGRIARLISASPDRREPPCSVYAECGGCNLQHISRAAQLRAKNDIIEAALRRIGGFKNLVCEEILAMDDPFRYRNKCVFQIGYDAAGNPAAGFFAGKSRRLIPASDCLLCPEDFGHAARALIGYMTENGVCAYDERTRRGVRQLFLRRSRSNGEIMAVVSCGGGRLPREDRLTERLNAASGRMASIYANKTAGNGLMGAEYRLLLGKPELSDTLCGLVFNISPAGFYQVNPCMAERLYEKALEYADISETDLVMDIYCGIGTISLAAARRAGRVIGIESVDAAVRDARKNAERNGIVNAEFRAGAAAALVPKLIAGGERPDIVILDPPRRGSDPATLAAIADAKPKRIVYVSCNPATLARDARFLAENGYAPTKCAGADMFANTSHVETVCQLVLRRSPVHINIDVDVEELVQDKRGQATYEQIKEYVLEHSGLKVSSLYIAQVKRKCGIIERENYNKPKSDDSRQPQCSPEKEAAIKDALEHFGMI